MKDQVIVEKILRILSDQFTYIVVSLVESHNIEEMTVDELQGTLNLHEKKFVRKKIDEGYQVLHVVEKYGGRSGRGRGSYRGRDREGFSRGGGKSSFNKATVECYKCHNLGNFQYDCPKWSKIFGI
ncbi:hypothetical protein LIER_33511 [Lithospermum erythrorhizon]|uniref:CCHC-type domain-containing protein n=1 Tax=Lithospermum erythrorhizon TaxID=34254 RepID=A0AAV3RWY1_LITER